MKPDNDILNFYIILRHQSTDFSFQFSVFRLFTPISQIMLITIMVRKRQKNKGKVATCALGITLKLNVQGLNARLMTKNWFLGRAVNC